MELKVGAVCEGTVTGITKFGAFVSLGEGKSGLVHISEIANAFVSDINEFLKVGDTVTVKIIGINDAGKINLSIKKAVDPPARPERRVSEPRPAPRAVETMADAVVDGPSGNKEFEDRLKKFMQESDSRIADNRRYAEHKQRRRR